MIEWFDVLQPYISEVFADQDNVRIHPLCHHCCTGCMFVVHMVFLLCAILLIQLEISGYSVLILCSLLLNFALFHNSYNFHSKHSFNFLEFASVAISDVTEAFLNKFIFNSTFKEANKCFLIVHCLIFTNIFKAMAA